MFSYRPRVGHSAEISGTTTFVRSFSYRFSPLISVSAVSACAERSKIYLIFTRAVPSAI